MNIKDKNLIINEAMEKVVNWLSSEARSISDSSQITAYHLACLTEEKFRMAALTGNNFERDNVAVHDQYRDWLFSLEWSLRFLSELPHNSVARQSYIRKRWNEIISRKCIYLLERMGKFKIFRDLIISASRGGYFISKQNPNILIFEDVPNWSGINDYKNYQIMELIEQERNIPFKNQFTIKEPTRKVDYSYKEFSHHIKTSMFLGSEFWEVYDYLFKICVNQIHINSKIIKQGKTYRSSPTEELVIMLKKDNLVRNISKVTGISNQKIKCILKWILFNSKTDKKLTLFHCPVIELNRNICLIAPLSILLGHPPTLFLRLLVYNDKKTHDSISSKMEKLKLKELASHLKSENTIEKVNCKIEHENIKIEIDIVQYDKVENKLNVVQTKMIIRPDSVVEVSNANKTISEGIKQLQSNKTFLESIGLKILLNTLGISVVSDPEINYFLMPIGFCGSDFLGKPDWIKIMLLDYCLLPKQKSKTLNQIWDEYQHLWKSFDEKAVVSKTTEEFELAGLQISYPGFLI